MAVVERRNNFSHVSIIMSQVFEEKYIKPGG